MEQSSPAPVDIIIRRPRAEDGRGIGLAHVLAWQIGYRGMIPDTHLDGLDPAERGRDWTQVVEQAEAGAADPDRPRTVVAQVAGRIAGFAMYGPYRTVPGDRPDHPAEELCELWAINVHPDHWGTGVAQALMAKTIDDLRTIRSEPVAALWVLEANARGRRFYHKVGWTADGANKTDEFAGTSVTEVRYTRRL